MNEPRAFLSRVYDAKYRFEKQAGFVATQLFLGPKEYREFLDTVVSDEKVRKELYAHEGGDWLAGMTVIGLASDGMRAGISTS